ncbi:MAG TPA: ABC transporter permease [Gaiellaceae bacterium]|nr:ABC transporter permease [Gaiellaceae bacterium]
MLEGTTVGPRRRLPTRLGGVVGSLITVVAAFLFSGIAIAALGKNPLTVYRAIFDGTGFNFFFHAGSHSIRLPFATTHVWFPWDTASIAAQNLQQTLLLTTPVVLTALAVAFAFRGGLFNIGGQGQYLVGAYFAVWIGSSLPHISSPLHIALAVGAATVAGAAYAGIAGLLRATVGAHEVITTIMLNWTAVWVGSYLFSQGGPLQSSTQRSLPESNLVAAGARLPVFWGPKLLQGLTIGVFFAIVALVVFWVVMNRTTLGFEMRAVGLNPAAARYGGIPVARSMVLAMALGGAFAGLAGACDVLGWEFQIGQPDVQASSIGFMGLAAALLGRNTAVGIGASSLLFGALINGTSGRQLDPTVFRPDLASALTTIIQGLVVLFVGLNAVAAWRWFKGRRSS